MTTQGSVPRAAAALLVASGLVLAQIAPVASPQTAPPAKPSTAPPPAKSSSTAPAPVEDGGWPRDLVTPSGGAIRIFQPQVASWDGQRRMVMYAAVAFNA